MSSADQTGIDPSKKITFKFCKECSNMLYPQEDREKKELVFTCRTCMYSEPPESACVFRDDLTNTVGDTAGITQDIGQDPTVGLQFPDLCTVCGQEIVCERCGQHSVAGCWLEVHEDEEDTEMQDSESGYVTDPSSDDEDEYELQQINEFINGTGALSLVTNNASTIGQNQSQHSAHQSQQSSQHT